MTPRLATAHVRWELRRADGSGIDAFTAVYTLARVEGAWRIAALAHDELPALQAAVHAAGAGPD